MNLQPLAIRANNIIDLVIVLYCSDITLLDVSLYQVYKLFILSIPDLQRVTILIVTGNMVDHTTR